MTTTIRYSKLAHALWVAELAIAVFPSAALLILGLFPYLTVVLALPAALAQGDFQAAGPLTLLTIMIFGGTLGLIAIIMARNPAKLRTQPRRLVRAAMFGIAGLCAEVAYCFSVGQIDLTSHAFLTIWTILGPLIVGAHIVYRVAISPRSEP